MLYADLVLLNGKIASMDGVTDGKPTPIVEALAVRDGIIIATGSNADMAPYTGGQTQMIDLGGATAIPGIIDSHCHPDGTALDLDKLNVVYPDFKSIDDVLKAIERHVETAGPDD